MAKSKYEYVKLFERDDTLLPSTYIVIRLDGRGFHRLTKVYGFTRPNDKRGLDLMNTAAHAVVKNLSDIAIAYGVSDEYSFVFYKTCTLFQRRESKLLSTVVSTFTAHYCMNWPLFFPDTPLSDPLPTFDARAVLYPSAENLKDYMRWRQADCHINNLYNTTFWALVQNGGLSNLEAEQKLKGTLSGDKNEMLFSQFGINYNNEDAMFRKGSVIYRNETGESRQDENEEKADKIAESSGKTSRKQREAIAKAQRVIKIDHIDIIKDDFWDERSWLLA